MPSTARRRPIRLCEVSLSRVDAAMAADRPCREPATFPDSTPWRRLTGRHARTSTECYCSNPSSRRSADLPVIENSATSVFGSAVGLLVDWEPFDFGLRKSRADLAQSIREACRPDVRNTIRSRFGRGRLLPDDPGGQETVKAARPASARSQVMLTTVEALVLAALRPGVDAAVARAEFAAAQTQVSVENRRSPTPRRFWPG